MKIKLKDIKQLVEGVVKNALSEQEKEDPRFGRYKSSLTKTLETVDIEGATRKHAQAMGILSAALKDALSVGGAVKVMEISKQIEELNRDLEQEIESIIRSYDKYARPMEEQEEAPVAPQMTKGAQKVAQKLDKASGLATSVKVVTKPGELEEILTNFIKRLDTNKITDQDLIVVLKSMYAKAQKKVLR